MKLNDFHTQEPEQKLQHLAKNLKDYGIDLEIYESLSCDELEMFLNDLENKKYKYVLESSFSSCYEDSEYTRLTLLTEALRIMLREISPRRKPKKLRPLIKESQEVDETLDYKVHAPTSAAVDHDIDEDKERPDLYWRKHQWEEERTQENLPVSAEDAAPAGEAYDTNWEVNNETPEEIDQRYEEEGEKMDAYAKNLQPVGGTHENEQQAGIYVAVMDPNRFLSDDDSTKVMAIEPVNKSANETSPLSMKVAPKMVDAFEADPDLTEFEIAGNVEAAHAGKKPSKIIAVYEDGEEMTENESRLKGIGDLVENTLLAEGELERAEVVLASRDIVTKLQGMIQDIGKMGTEDIMPMIDGVRNNFGANMAATFSSQTEQMIQTTADSIEDFKNTMENWSAKFETRISDEDVQEPVSDMSTDAIGGDEDENSLIGAELPGDLDTGELGVEHPDDDADLTDELGGDDAAASEEPLGRAKKEEGRVVNLGGKKVKLTNEQVLALAKAKRIMERVRTLGSSTVPSLAMLNTVVIDVHGKKIRLNEEQVKALVFAKNWKKMVEAKKAKSVRLSESQAKKIMLAKKLTEKIEALTKKSSIFSVTQELDEKWDKETKTPKSEKGKYKGKTKAELEKMLAAVKKSGPHKKGSKEYERQNELEFALRAKSGWGKVPESNELDEKWKGDADVKATGEWSKHTVAELEKKAEALRKKKDHTAAETKRLKQINFAIRAKRNWKGGAK